VALLGCQFAFFIRGEILILFTRGEILIINMVNGFEGQLLVFAQTMLP
jgi:hypothetical protein